jgi:C1A family cysteine protease
MVKLIKCVFGIIFFIQFIFMASAAPSIEIIPDVLHQNMPIEIHYSGFSDGDLFKINFSLENDQNSYLNPMVMEGPIIFPFELKPGSIKANNGDLIINDKIVTEGEFSDLSKGHIFIRLIQNKAISDNGNPISFQITGRKISGSPDNSLFFTPHFSPKTGNLTVTVTINGMEVSRQILFNMEYETTPSSQMTEEPKVTSLSHGLMYFSPEEAKQNAFDYLSLPTLPNSKYQSVKGQKSILNYIPYVPTDRDQGNCGNCWVWASTGSIEGTHSIQSKISDRLSIQYFNSNYNSGSGSDWACNGGNTKKFADFYNAAPHQQVIPWNNTNASFVDQNACPANDCSGGTRMPAQFITMLPKYPINSISSSEISTHVVSKEQAIDNIKEQIDLNVPVVWSYYLPNDSSWADFNNFWTNQDELALWNPDPYNNIPWQGLGHGVLIVGYNDSSSNPEEWYWEVLNSWGITQKRPNGLFRLKMNIDYNGNNGMNYNNYFHIFHVAFADQVYHSISATAGSGGSISPSGNVMVLSGNSQQFTITPDNGFNISQVIVDGENKGATSSYLFSTVMSNHTIHAEFSSIPPSSFIINASSGLGGQISPSGFIEVCYGCSQTFTISPDPGYVIHDVLVDGGSIGAVPSHTFSNVTSNHTISSSFIVQPITTHTINASSGVGGQISPSGFIEVCHGCSQTFTINPDSGYLIHDVFVDGGSIGAVPSHTFSNVTSNHTISSSFIVQPITTHTINASSGVGGQISPSGFIEVCHGCSQTFTISPDPGYVIHDVLVDGGSIGAVPSHTFSNVTSNHTISSSFIVQPITTHSINASSGVGGQISPSGFIEVCHGCSQTFTISPDPGYVIHDVLVDGGSIGAVPSHTFSNVTSNHTISSSFIVQPITTHTINASSGVGGQISPSGFIEVCHGCSQTFTISPDPGYVIHDVLVDGGSIGAVPSHTFSNVTRNHSIFSSFLQLPENYRINSSSNDWSITYPSGQIMFAKGANSSYLNQAKPGADLLDVKVDNQSKGPVELWQFTNITSNHEILSEGGPKTDQIHVRFNGTPNIGSAPLTVQFSDNTIGNPNKWNWQFGDGNMSYDKNPVYTYWYQGNYSVSLIASNEKTGGFSVWNNFIHVI